MPQYTPPRRLPTMRQRSPLPATMPGPGERATEITFPPQSPGGPVVFAHEHYQLTLTRSLTQTAEGEFWEITAQAQVLVSDVSGPPEEAGTLRESDRRFAAGEAARPQPRSLDPLVRFPVYCVLVDPKDEEILQEMMWRALEGAVSLADRCLDVTRQIAELRTEQIAQAEGHA